MSEKFKLIVKAANQSSLDQRIECDIDWTVQNLKEEISRTHPSNPSLQEQRLIYSGQLLQDSLLLQTVLRHPTENNEYIIHLVCSSPKSTSSMSIRHPQEQQSLRSSRPPVVPPLIINDNAGRVEPSGDSTADGVRHRLVSTEPPPPAGGPQQGFDPYLSQFTFPLQVTDPIQQMAAMQQMYAQYMTSYMQYIQSGNFGTGGRSAQESTPPSSGSPTYSDDQNTSDNGRPQLQDPNAGNDQEAQRNAQMRVNPPAVVAEEEGEGEGFARDWLDYIYFCSRMIVLLSIVYFYSTLMRFLLVACTTVFIYLYQCGWFRFWRAEEQVGPPEGVAQPPRANPPEADEAQANAPPPPARRDSTPEQNPPETPDETPHLQPTNGGSGSASPETPRDLVVGGRSGLEERPNDPVAPNTPEGRPTSIPNPTMEEVPPQPSLFALSWTFLTTFFTSLIPEQHQIV